MPRAAGLADEIKKKYGAQPKLIEGAGGVFDVHVNGTQVWSKHDIGRFPENHEVLERIDKLAGKQ
ncbi:MAG: Rdx family protein [Phycisphaerae bacterium]|nr:Rdx family protein [Phycisphaerae bacterium]